MSSVVNTHIFLICILSEITYLLVLLGGLDIFNFSIKREETDYTANRGVCKITVL